MHRFSPQCRKTKVNEMRSRFTRLLTIALLCLPLVPGLARAALTDEIQVYTDDINDPGKFGLELHVNSTPKGNTQPGYAGEVVTNHGLRVTPEFSYGLSKDFEAGLYLPTSYNNGNWSVGGYKLRLKWVPLKADEAKGGFFAGANGELANTNSKFEAWRHNFELRIMGGWRNKYWLFAVNPVFSWALSSSQETPKPKNPQFAQSYKVARTVVDGVAVGLEYYNEMGSLGSFDPSSQQSKTLYYAVDVTRGRLPFNFGIGRGLTGATDKWTVKAIFEIPFSL